MKNAGFRKITSTAGATALLATALASASGLIGAGPASAGVCGHYEKTEYYDSTISLPKPFTWSPFSGERRVAHYTHCTSDGSNVNVRVDTADGPLDLCLPPGESRLGFVNQDKRISYSYAIGGC
ncbi:DUF6355 family natural product biosynthesis protein [Arthrobacter sp. Z1-15]